MTFYYVIGFTEYVIVDRINSCIGVEESKMLFS
jgi:hypothetical protein